MKISIIIPTLNEEKNIVELLERLKDVVVSHNVEIIVSDGGSKDDTVNMAKSYGATVFHSPARGRAIQMNHAAKEASGEILYFVHADSRPPVTLAHDILSAVEEGYLLGCYQFQFDSPSVLLRINSFFTRFDRMMFRGGDQTLFVTKKVFEEFGGYDPNFKIMEEYDFLKRVRKRYAFKIMDGPVIVSARKYDTNSYLKVNFANLIVFTMYRLGYSQESMLRQYHRMLKQENYNFDLK